MKAVAIRCDRCGAEIDAGRALSAVQAGATPPAWPMDPHTGRPALDLCSACLDGLDLWLRRTSEVAGKQEGMT
jgi:hypothetical protein